MAIVSTGQITIVDNNDAKPITAYVTASNGTQQVYSKDESTVTYVPNWTSATNTLTAKVFVGGASSAIDVTAQLTNRKWSNDLSTSLGSGTTLVVNTNLTEATPSKVYYFEGDYTDPTTSLVSHVIAQITLSMVKTGTNAVYVLTRGKTSIEEATGTTKNVAVVTADLIRAAGHDTTNITYRFYEANGATQITTAHATEYGMKTIASGAASTGTASDIGLNLPAAAAWSTHNTLVIHESAVTDMGVYRVEAKDNDGTIYQAYFTVYDVSDPYDVRILSSTGDKLQNGVGSTDLIPLVYCGSAQVTNLTGWTFTWTFYNKDGKRGAFIDTTRTAAAGGRNITANTSGVSGVFTYDGTAIAGWAAGQIIKCVKPDGSERFYEVASATGNTVTIRTPTTNTWLNYTDFPAPAAANDFVGGKFFACVGSGGQRSTSAAAAITVTGDEIDIKGRIVCEANRP